MQTQPPLPPFTPETAAQKVCVALDARNMRHPQRLWLVDAGGGRRRGRAEFPLGRGPVGECLRRQRAGELEERLIQEPEACAGYRIALRFAGEGHDASGKRLRSSGNRQGEFDAQGCRMRRPDEHPGPSELGR